jgi:quinohemoprotein ethanol dehydrogenase
MQQRKLFTAVALLALLATACSQRSDQNSATTKAAPQTAGNVTQARLANVASEPGEWLAGGRDAGKTHYSPLDAINRDTASRLGFAWEYTTDTARGMGATPIVVDGVMFTSGVAGRVYALDAATGALRWKFEPPLKLRNARGSCCDILNRGVAVWEGRVYVGAFEGILFALDANDGKVLWQVDTITDRSRAYAITGAPQIAGDVVVIGNGGAEFDSRGYVSAYDRTSGDLRWRFYTVPGDPSKPFENPALEMAAKTWDPKRDLAYGGGGNAWDAFAYDAESDLVYFGTANGAPWSRAHRSPSGGDNLFLASIVALNAKTGDYVWHYQQTPGERWDYDATAHLMIATLNIGGAPRKVLMQASKNAFYYIHDARTGELLAADKFVDANWASHVDLKTGQPVINANADYSKGKPVIVFPSGVGGHNFNPMSLSQRTGLVYIPTTHSGMGVIPTPLNPYAPQRSPGGTRTVFATQLQDTARLPPELKAIMTPAYMKTVPNLEMGSTLKAWDPIARKVVWSFPGNSFMDHSGVLSTAGGWVAQGSLDGKLRILNDETGKVIKEIDTGSPIIAAPMTYTVGGTQYVAVLTGSGGGGWNVWIPGNVARERGNTNRILAFKLDGIATRIPPLLPAVAAITEPPALTASAADITAGAALYGRNCGGCHANLDRAPVPDLRRSAVVRDSASFASVVLKGALETRGMPGWDDLLKAEEVEQIRAHLLNVTHSAWRAQQEASPKAEDKPAAASH